MRFAARLKLVKSLVASFVNQMDKKTIIGSALMVLIALPGFVSAFDNINQPSVMSGIQVRDLINVIFSIVWPTVIAFFVAMFLFASFQFSTAQGDEAKLLIARKEIVWGLVGLVIAILAFSIPFIVKNLLNI